MESIGSFFAHKLQAHCVRNAFNELTVSERSMILAIFDDTWHEFNHFIMVFVLIRHDMAWHDDVVKNVDKKTLSTLFMTWNRLVRCIWHNQSISHPAKNQQIDILSVFRHDKVRGHSQLMGFLSTYTCFLCFTLVQNLKNSQILAEMDA